MSFKKYTITDEDLKVLVKSVYKTILKSLKDKKKEAEARAIVEDILDPDSEAEANNVKTKEKVMTKSMNGVEKLKKFMDEQKS